MSRNSRTLFSTTTLVVTALFLLVACAGQAEEAKKLMKLAKSFSPDTKSKLGKEKNEDSSKSRYLSVQANKREESAELGVDIPYDLHGAFRVEMTYGVFSQKRVENLGNGSFGLEIRSTVNPGEFYAVYARYQAAPEGLLVRAESHDGQHGQETLIPLARADAAAESDGASITLYAKAAGDGGPFMAIATVPLATPAGAHVPAFAVSGISDRSQVGFTNLVVPMNGLPKALTARTNLGREIEKNFMEGVRTLFEILRLANNGIPTASGIAQIKDRLVLAQGSFEVARGMAFGVEENNASRTVIAETGKIVKKLTKLQVKVGSSDARTAGNAVVSTLTKKLLRPVQKTLDAIPDLGDTKPLPPGIDLYTAHSYALINNTGKPIDINDVIIDITQVTVTKLNEENEEFQEAGTPFRVSYREEYPETYNDDPDNFNDRLFPDSFLSLMDGVYYEPPTGAIRINLTGTVTVDTHQYGILTIEIELEY